MCFLLPVSPRQKDKIEDWELQGIEEPGIELFDLSFCHILKASPGRQYSYFYYIGEERKFTEV